MKQWQIEGSAIVLREAEAPKYQEHEVLMRVEAIGLNRADLLQIEGLYPAAVVPGLEVCGTDVNSGHKLCALLESGGYAEYVAVPRNQTCPLPDCYSPIEGAGWMEASLTAYMNLSKMQPNPGETILVHGGSSGVGSMAIKIAKLMGLKVIATVGDQSKLQRCLEIGADQVYSYQEGFADHLTKSVDMILDMLGGDYFTHNISCLKHNGRIAVIAVMQGSKAIAPLGTMLMRNISVFFSTLRSLDNTAKASLLAGFLQKFEHSMQTGALKPCIDSTFSFTSLPKAMERMKNRDHFGKIIIHPIS